MKNCKLVVMGPGGVGKSCLIVHFVSGHFPEEMDPTIEDYYSKRIDVDGSPIMLEILDTAGQEEFSAMREQYMRSGEAFIIVYSICDAYSFKSIRDLKKQVDRVKDEIHHPYYILVGNMSDLKRREVTTQEGEDLAREWGCPFIETSAKENNYVQEIFYGIVREKLKTETGSNSLEPRHRHRPCVCL